MKEGSVHKNIRQHANTVHDMSVVICKRIEHVYDGCLSTVK